MLLRNRTARLIAAGALALTAATLAGCSTSMETDRIYTQAVGANHQSGKIDVLNAVIVTTKGKTGTFVATLVNNLFSGPSTARTSTTVWSVSVLRVCPGR